MTLEGSAAEEIALYQTSKEREVYDEQANLYAIITATEHLERAYARDAIDPKDYTLQVRIAAFISLISSPLPLTPYYHTLIYLVQKTHFTIPTR